jgi:transposase-like protein
MGARGNVFPSFSKYKNRLFLSLFWRYHFFMGRKNKYTKEIKLKAILDYEKGVKSIIQLCNELDCSHMSIRAWIRGYRALGDDFFNNKTNRSYTEEFKLMVIKDYLLGNGSSYDLAQKYKIPSKAIVLDWVSKYNKGKDIKKYNPKPEVYKMKARKTTFEERIEIVNYCLENNKNFKETADKYNIPYNLVYQWVKRYESDGKIALGYTRKGPKPKVILPSTPEESAQAEIERLKRELARKELEIEILKKKQYFEKIIYSQKSDK